MNDPDAVTMILWLLIWCALMAGVGFLCSFKTKRNRYTRLQGHVHPSYWSNARRVDHE